MRVKGGSTGGGEAGGRGVGGERSYTSNRSTPRDTHWQILDDVLARRTKRRHGNRLFFFFYFYFFHYLLNSLFFSLFSNWMASTMRVWCAAYFLWAEGRTIPLVIESRPPTIIVPYTAPPSAVSRSVRSVCVCIRDREREREKSSGDPETTLAPLSRPNPPSHLELDRHRHNKTPKRKKGEKIVWFDFVGNVFFSFSSFLDSLSTCTSENWIKSEIWRHTGCLVRTRLLTNCKKGEGEPCLTQCERAETAL
jgi:hypothetical protein